jgi:Rrf2 family protein
VKLTTKSEYTILALIYLARQSEGVWVKIEEICRQFDIPKKYLELLLMPLRQNRYVQTRRGANGGYRLMRPANQITIAEIVRLMDGPLAPTESVSKYFFSVTPLSQEPKMLAVCKEIRDYIANRLEKLTLADLV